MSEQSPADSEASILDRLAALSATPEAASDQPPEEGDEASSQEVTTEVTDEQTEVKEDDGFVEVEYEGAKFRAPAKAKDAFMATQDYTRKTQETARLAEAAQDRLHFAEAREAVVSAVMQEMGELKVIESQLASFANVDWGALYAADPGQAMKYRDQRDQLQRSVAEKQAQIHAKAREAQEMAGKHAERQWSLAIEGAKARIGTYTAAEDEAMAVQARELGFTEKELKGRFADPRVLHALFKAAKYDAVQKNKPGALAAIQKAPPVVKPGAAKGPQAASQQRYQDIRQRLKKTGSDKDSIALFRMLETRK